MKQNEQLEIIKSVLEAINYNIDVFLFLWRSLRCVSFGKVYIVQIT